jgi:hypothetical protein
VQGFSDAIGSRSARTVRRRCSCTPSLGATADSKRVGTNRGSRRLRCSRCWPPVKTPVDAGRFPRSSSMSNRSRSGGKGLPLAGRRPMRSIHAAAVETIYSLPTGLRAGLRVSLASSSKGLLNFKILGRPTPLQCSTAPRDNILGPCRSRALAAARAGRRSPHLRPLPPSLTRGRG